jgi:hypothetical protein
MARLNTNDAVSVTFKTENINGTPFQNVQLAKVVSHKAAGWLTLRFKTGTQYQYRVHSVENGGGEFENHKKAKVFVNVKKQDT